MDNILKYAAFETESFSAVPFCVEDSMIFSLLAYLRYDGYLSEPSMLSRSMTITKAAESGRIEKLLAGVNNRSKMRELLEALAINPRFCSIKMKFYSNRFSVSAQKQFSAVTFFLDDRTAYVAFRGTDSTLVGWRENLTMAYEYPVPAQQEAADYLERVARFTGRRLHVGGHSKGGNLAMYAAMNCSERTAERIIDVYSFDGPGFSEAVVASPEYARIKERVHKIVPSDSFIGTLLRQGESYSVVRSSAHGLQQHDMFTWVFSDNRLEYAQTLTAGAVKFDMVLDRWLAGMDSERRREVVGLVFLLMDRTGASTMKGLIDFYRSQDNQIAKVLHDVEPAKRRILFQELASLVGAYIGTAINLRPHGDT